MNGQSYLLTELITYIRKNNNQFHNQSGTSFDLISQDISLWNSPNPLTSVKSISIAADDGSVICSDYEDNHWVFTTLKAPGWIQCLWSPSNDGYHPVSGNRQFGVSNQNDIVLYTKGVERVTQWYHNLFEQSAFSGADELWSSMENMKVTWINDNEGIATKFTTTQNRFYRLNWDIIKNQLMSPNKITKILCN